MLTKTTAAVLLSALVCLLQGMSIVAADGGGRATVAYGTHKSPLVDQEMGLSIYGPGGERLARIDGSATQTTITDHLSSVRLTRGGEAARYEYGPYGATTANATDSIYAGHPHDTHQALYETPSRPYDPSLGRFLGHDTAPGGTSPYAYAGLNPITNLDPGGDVDIPFFIMSGFGTGDNSGPNSPAMAISIKTAISSVGPRQVVRDSRIFSYHPNEPPGVRFYNQRESLIRVNLDSNSYRHDNTVYWLVGIDANTEVRRPLDVLEVFSYWRGLRPGIASRVMVVDTSWEANRSQPIRDALDEAGIAYAFISTGTAPSDSIPSTRQYSLANWFRLGDSMIHRNLFASYVQQVMDQHDTQMANLARLMPPPNQPPPGSQQSTSEAGPSSAPDPVVEMPSITTDQPSVEPMEIPMPHVPSMDEVSLRGSDPFLSSTSTEELPVMIPAPLDSINPGVTIRY